MKGALERELKLEVDPDFELPGHLGEPLDARLFVSTYHDTPARSLLRCGLTLRRRLEGGRSLWQLKLPREGGRQELEAPGGPARPPEELLRLLPLHLQHGPLEPVATLRTRRAGYRVADNGHAVADVTLDNVDVLDGHRQAGAFREVEVELVDGDEADLQRVGRALRRAGAHASDGRSKVLRVVDVHDDAPDPFNLRAQLREIERFDPGVRLGDDPEDLHRFRVATRRTRAIVRATQPLLGDRLDELSSELKWLAGVLGPVRDLDVLLDHLTPLVAKLDDDRPAGEELLAILAAERARLRDAMVEAMSSPRYFELLALFEREVDALYEPAGDTVELAAAAFGRLRRHSRRVDSDSPDEQVHDLRKQAKKARYAVELVPGGDERYLAALKNLQDVVGEHQDAVVAEERLRKIARARTAIAAGRLIERERRRRAQARKQLEAALGDVLDRGKKAL